MRFSHLIWDFDGTLFDTYPALITSIEQALADFDASVPRARIAALLRGTMSGALALLADEHGLRVDLLEARMRAYHMQTTVRDQRPFPGAMSFLERVLASGGHNYLVTHRDADSLSQLMNWYRISGFFTDIITSDDGFPRKPDPASITAMIERNQLPRAEVLVIGDRDLDIRAGKASRVQTCLFNGVLTACMQQPEYMVETYADLSAIVQFATISI